MIRGSVKAESKDARRQKVCNTYASDMQLYCSRWCTWSILGCTDGVRARRTYVFLRVLQVTEFEATLTRMDTRVISDGPLVIAAALLSGFALSALMSMFSASSIESYTGSSSDGAARLYAGQSCSR